MYESMYVVMCMSMNKHTFVRSVFMFADGMEVEEQSVSRFRVSTAKKTVTIQVRRMLVFDWLTIPVWQ